MANANKDWTRIKRDIRSIRNTCHGLTPTRDGIKCFATVDRMQDELRKIFMERRRRQR